MKIPKGLVPLQVVAEDIGVSRSTLWRASKSNIPGFPAPVIIRRLVYWRKGDVPKLDDAMFLYKGRCAFERLRDHERKVQTLKKRTPRPKRARRNARAPDPGQQDLF